MVVSDLRSITRQAAMTATLRKAIDFLSRPGVADLPDGRQEIDGERVFALVQRYETALSPAPRFECHRKYIDVQFLAAGEEVIGWAPAGDRSTMESRVWPKPSPASGSTKVPPASGPRWASRAAMAPATASSSCDPGRRSSSRKPAMPHMAR